MPRLTQAELLARAIAVHGDRYDYSLVETDCGFLAKADKNLIGRCLGGEPAQSTVNFFKKCLLVTVLGLPALSLAQTASDESSEPASPAISLGEIAMELSNPVTALRSLAWDIEGTTFQGSLPGADNRSSMRNVFTPSWPFKLRNGNNILFRVTVPINSDQPLWELAWWDHSAVWRLRQREDIRLEQGFLARGHDHRDDISIDVAYGGVSDNGFIGMLGLSTVLPLSEDGSAERDQLSLGPEFVLGKVTSWGLIGARVKHLKNVYEDHVSAGYVDELPWDTNETTVKIFFAYAMGDGWQIESNPTILYDWEAISGHDWTVPIGGGVSKTMRLGSVPVKLAFNIQKYLVSPDRLGPDWQLTISLTPVLSTKLLR